MVNNLIGQKFGRLIVIQRMDNDRWGHHRWLCRCDCKEEKIIMGQSLRNGDTKSCGCLKIKHGHRIRIKISGIYNVWQNMIQRCTNPKTSNYKHYGGRGITVCKRWKNSFENFLEDMGEMPKGYQIDRINNNGNYCKSNCRWVTSKQNSRNTRRSRLETYKGKTQCLVAWAEEYNINYSTLWCRICRYNWSIEKALTTSVIKKRK